MYLVFFGGVRLAYQNSTEKNDGNVLLDLMNISDGVHKLQSSKVLLIYYKPYVSDILLINVNFYDSQGWSKKIQPKKADQKKPKKSTQNFTYPAGFFWLLLKNVSFINILVLFSLFTIIKPKILIYIANRSTQNTSKDLIFA